MLSAAGAVVFAFLGLGDGVEEVEAVAAHVAGGLLEFLPRPVHSLHQDEVGPLGGRISGRPRAVEDGLDGEEDVFEVRAAGA